MCGYLSCELRIFPARASAVLNPVEWPLPTNQKYWPLPKLPNQFSGMDAKNVSM